MNRNKIIIFTAITALFFSCAQKKVFDREDSFHSYMEKVVAHKFQPKEIIFVLNNGRCGTCYQEDIHQLQDIFRENTIPKTIILAEAAPSIQEPLSVLPKVHFFIDNNINLGKYGLAYGSDLVFLLENGKIEAWTPIKGSNMDFIRQNIK